MRRSTMIGVLVLVGAVAVAVDPREDAKQERITVLVRQLGHQEFAKREAAGKELDAIGEPALDALRKAASDGDPEVRQRAEGIIRAVTGRMRAAAAKKELARWQGGWTGDEGQKMTIDGDQWASGTPTFGPISGTLRGIDVRETMTAVDLVVEDGPTKGHTCRAIFRLDGDTLHYCGTYGATRPTEFKSVGNNIYVAWKRAKKGVQVKVLPPAVQFDSDAFSTDLPLPESKLPVHRVALKIPPADGGEGTLTLDPTAPKFDAFGDPAAGGKPAPAVTLECTLKLTMKGKERRLYELRGPKVVSRLSLVVYPDVMPWGDARLLVHGKDGEVRYAINLRLPQPVLHPPCHPGCFPAGTRVHVPGGTMAVERIREGDLVTTIGADGKASPAKVTGVFVTRNRVLEVRVEGRTLVTTTTQPIALVGGGFRAAGELKVGDRVWRWINNERRAAAVTAVTPADREVGVFNLILGEPTGFVAGGFVVRSKPPAAVVRP